MIFSPKGYVSNAQNGEETLQKMVEKGTLSQKMLDDIKQQKKGISHGYIERIYTSPTTLHWSKAKRAVTSFINNRDYDSKTKAASKYATAMKTDMSTGGSFQSAAARTLGFAQKVSSGGLDNALREYNREDLVGKPSRSCLDRITA